MKAAKSAALHPAAAREHAAPIVLKLGGRALEQHGAVREFASALSRLGGPVVIVHGGGAEVSEWSERLGLAPSFIDGLRVTDLATLEVAVAVLAGLANKRLVAALRAEGLDAVGFAAVDGGMADVEPHPRSHALGEVGEVRTIHPHLIEVLLAEGRIPVLASIGAHDGRLLNVNADDLACAVAAALGAPTLALFSDVEGVNLGGRIARRLTRADLDRALADAEVQGGMIAKLVSARRALDQGVGTVAIARWSGPGTLEALIDHREAGTVLGDAERPSLEETRHE
ncbi:MAG: acetylglutamate kinase [Candidatus Eisenbacteria bacterium]|nr:acetylglutamate kinase [Candidatus Eisenbacteria bacterium]